MKKLVILLSFIFSISLNCLAMEQNIWTNQSTNLKIFNNLLSKFRRENHLDQNDLIAAYFELNEREQSEVIRAHPDLKYILDLVQNEEEMEIKERHEDTQDIQEIEDSKIFSTTITTNTNSTKGNRNSEVRSIDIDSNEAATILEETANNANAFLTKNEQLSKILEQTLQEYKDLQETNSQLSSENNNLINQVLDLKQKINNIKEKLTGKVDVKNARACQLLVSMNCKRRLEIEELKKIKTELLKNSNK